MATQSSGCYIRRSQKRQAGHLSVIGGHQLQGGKVLLLRNRGPLCKLHTKVSAATTTSCFQVLTVNIYMLTVVCSFHLSQSSKWLLAFVVHLRVTIAAAVYLHSLMVVKDCCFVTRATGGGG